MSVCVPGRIYNFLARGVIGSSCRKPCSETVVTTDSHLLLSSFSLFIFFFCRWFRSSRVSVSLCGVIRLHTVSICWRRRHKRTRISPHVSSPTKFMLIWVQNTSTILVTSGIGKQSTVLTRWRFIPVFRLTAEDLHNAGVSSPLFLHLPPPYL